MKVILIIISLVIASTTAANFKLKVNGYNHDENVEKTAWAVVNELEPLLNKPLNWCTVKPTGDMQALRKGHNSTKVIISVDVKCDHRVARKLLKKIWNKYDRFLWRHGKIVDSIMERQYPDYHLNWGYLLNEYTFIQLKLLRNFGGTTTFHNKCLFFRLTFNDDVETLPMRIDMPGNLLKIVPTNSIPNRPSVKTYKFLVTIPNKYLDDGELDIKLDRVWHLVNNERYISTY